MGWRYRKSFSILPGPRLNIGKRGFTSLSVGGRGVTLNLGKEGVTSTVSLPGTGLSYQHRSKNSPSAKPTVAALSGAAPIGRAFSVKACVIGAVVVGGYMALCSLTPSSSPPSVTVATVIESVAQAETSTASATPAVQKVVVRSPSIFFQTRQVRTMQAHVRAAPSMSGAVVRTLLKGQAVQVLQTENGWTQVAEKDGVTIGWMNESVLQ